MRPVRTTCWRPPARDLTRSGRAGVPARPRRVPSASLTATTQRRRPPVSQEVIGPGPAGRGDLLDDGASPRVCDAPSRRLRGASRPPGASRSQGPSRRAATNGATREDGRRRGDPHQAGERRRRGPHRVPGPDGLPAGRAAGLPAPRGHRVQGVQEHPRPPGGRGRGPDRDGPDARGSRGDRVRGRRCRQRGEGPARLRAGEPRPGGQGRPARRAGHRRIRGRGPGRGRTARGVSSPAWPAGSRLRSPRRPASSRPSPATSPTV